MTKPRRKPGPRAGKRARFSRSTLPTGNKWKTRGLEGWIGLIERVNAVTGGMSYRELGRQVGFNHETLRRYCLFKSEPGIRFISRFVECFEVDPTWLLTGRRGRRGGVAKKS